MESFQTAPVVRFYGSEAVGEAEADDVAAAAPTVEPAAPELRLVPPRPARGPGRIVAVAAAAGLAAVALATWAFVSTVRAVDDEAPASPPTAAATPDAASVDRAVALLAEPTTSRYRFAGSLGRITLAVTPEGRGFLVLNGLGPAPAGGVYQAWVISTAGRSLRSAARFRGHASVVPLTGRVREGAAVAITLERAPGAAGPSRTPRLVAVRRSS